MFDYIVVGAGFAGAVVAERLATQLEKKVLIIEKRNHIGGNCYDYRDENNILIHKYGPHLFHTDNKEVFNYLSQFTDWHKYQHKVLAFIDGQKVPIPFNFNSINKVFPEITARRLQKKLLKRYGQDTKIPILKLREERDEDLKSLADFVYEKVFLNYSAKQWGVRPDDIDPAVTARVPVFIGWDDRYFNDQYQGIPMDGYTGIFTRMLCHSNIEILLNTDFREVMKVDCNAGRIFFKDVEFTGTVIFTGMIDEFFNYQFGPLPYRSLDLQFETLSQEIFQETATVNYPNDFDFTRITEFKHIHPLESQKTTILKEYPKDYKVGVDIPYYPVFTDSNRNLYLRYKQLSGKFNNLVMLGRLAEYQYYDMDDIVEKALEAFRKLCDEK